MNTPATFNKKLALRNSNAATYNKLLVVSVSFRKSPKLANLVRACEHTLRFAVMKLDRELETLVFLNNEEGE